MDQGKTHFVLVCGFVPKGRLHIADVLVALALTHGIDGQHHVPARYKVQLDDLIVVLVSGGIGAKRSGGMTGSEQHGRRGFGRGYRDVQCCRCKKPGSGLQKQLLHLGN